MNGLEPLTGELFSEASLRHHPARGDLQSTSVTLTDQDSHHKQHSLIHELLLYIYISFLNRCFPIGQPLSNHPFAKAAQ